MTSPLQIFIAYARKDTSFLDELRVQLKPLERSGKVKIWYDGEIQPGEVWEASIKKHLHGADIILMMVSPDAIASDYFYEKEMADALQRHDEGSAIVVPFIIRPCAWQNNTPLGKLQALPKDGKAVTRWPDRDHAFADAVNALEELVEKKLAGQQAEMQRREAGHRAAEEAKRQQEATALAAQKAAERERELAERQKSLKEQQAQLEKIEQQQREAEEKHRREEAAKQAERRRQAEVEKQRHREAALLRRKEQQHKVVAGLRSPWAWGSGLVLLLLFVFIQMCNWPDANLSDDQVAEADSLKNASVLLDSVNDTDKPVVEKKLPDPCASKGGDKDQDGICADKDCNDSDASPGASTDSDGDGLCDDVDKCDYEKGPASNNGCPVKEEKPDPPKKRKSGFEMVQVTGGTYTMGSPKNETDREDDECQHPVTVGDFQIGRYEVTQADWREVMGEDPPELKFKGCNDCPVDRVSWDDIQDFLKKASAKYGVKYRLPTEEEWEYAARGGNKSNRYKYAGSNTIGDVAWYISNSSKKTHPVGGKKANELGLYDMSGNVWEWCADKWGPYPNCTASDCSNCRVARGGPWNGSDGYCRVANRDWGSPSSRLINAGFRLARY